jgi:hypothetical protein
VSAPLCTKCGAALPDPRWPRTGIICPGCGAKNEVHTVALDAENGAALTAFLEAPRPAPVWSGPGRVEGGALPARAGVVTITPRTQAPESEREAIDDAVDMLARGRAALAESEARAMTEAAERIAARIYPGETPLGNVRQLRGAVVHGIIAREVEIASDRKDTAAAAHAAGVAEGTARALRIIADMIEGRGIAPADDFAIGGRLSLQNAARLIASPTTHDDAGKLY